MTAELLTKHRAGDANATRQLIESYLPLAKEYCKRQLSKLLPYMTEDDLLSQTQYDLTVAVDRLKRNDTPPELVERYIRGELKHSYKHLHREMADDILPDSGGGEPIRRVRPPKRQVAVGLRQKDASQYISVLDDPFCDPFEIPSRFLQMSVETEYECQEEYDRWLAVAETPLERNIAGFLLVGHDTVDIAKNLYGVTKSQVKAIMKRLKEKADAKETMAIPIAVPAKRTAFPHCALAG